MSQRPFWPYAFLCMLLVALALAAAGWLFYGRFERNLDELLAEENLRAARLAARMLAGPDPAQLTEELAELSDARVTVIGLDGTVLADSEHDTASMENHGGRPEVEAAIGAGFGHATRRSETLGVVMLYTAVKAEGAAGAPARIVRLARPMNRIRTLTLSFSELAWTALPVAVMVVVLAFYLLIEVRIARVHRPS